MTRTLTRTLLLSFVLGRIAHATPPPTAKAVAHDEGAHSAWADHDRDKWRNKLVKKKKKKSKTIMLAPSQPK